MTTPQPGRAAGFDGDPDGPAFIATTNNGFRSWALGLRGRVWGLQSMVWTYTWQPGTNTAACFRGDACEVGYPNRDCSCGFYAYYRARNWVDPQDLAGPLVSGIIEGWGRTVVGSAGFRSEYARVAGLVVDPRAISWPWLDKANLSRKVGAFAVREWAELAMPDVPIFPTVRDLLDAFPLRGRPMT